MSTDSTSIEPTSADSAQASSNSALQACLDIFTAPTKAFNSVKGKKGWAWVPFILVIALSSGVYAHYFSVVDIDWFQDQSLEQAAAFTGMSYEELKANSPAADATSSMIQTIIGIVLTLIIVNLISAVYYLLATKITAKNDLTFKDWFAFSWWTVVPMILASLVSILVIFFATNGNIAMTDLQPTSLNSLIFSVEQSNPWFNFLEAISVFSLWIVALASIGLKSWLNIDTKKSVILAIIPSVIMYGLWALYIVL